MAIYGQCQQCRHFDGNTCALFTPIYDGRGCESFARPGTSSDKSLASAPTTPDSPHTDTEYPEMQQSNAPQVVFDDSYKYTPSGEPLGLWLKLFLYLFMGCGSVLTLCLALYNINPGPYGHWTLWDLALSVTQAVIAGYTIFAFLQRDQDAVFLAKTFLAFRVIMSGYAVWFGLRTNKLAIGILWFICTALLAGGWYIYLIRSKHVQRLIPESYRERRSRDRVLITIAGSCALLMYGAAPSFHPAADAKLRSDQLTDGKVVYTIPIGYEGNDTIIGDATMIHLKGRLEDEVVFMISEYNSKATESTFEQYFEGCKPDILNHYDYTLVNDKTYTINGCTVFYRRVRVQPDFTIDWEFALAFHRASGRMCIIYAFTQSNHYSPIEGIISKLEFP